MTISRDQPPAAANGEPDDPQFEKIRSDVRELLGDEFVLGEDVWREGTELHLKAGVHDSRREFLLRVVVGQRLIQRSHKRMERELLLADRFEHPNLERVITGGIAPGLTVTVSEWPVHGTLEQRLREVECLELDELVGILRHVAVALDYAQSLGTLHGRLIPACIQLHRNYVTVRGMGAVEDATLPVSADELSLPHVAAYLAPEQWQADGEVDARADQYALAVIAYEALTGHRRVETSAAGGIPTLTVLEIAPDLPLRQGVPLRVNATLRRALARDPAHRFRSCKEFVAALAGEIETPRSLPTIHASVERKERRRSLAPLMVMLLLVALTVAAVLPPGRLIVRRELPEVDVAFDRFFTWIGVELPGGAARPGERRDPIVNARVPGSASGSAPAAADPARVVPTGPLPAEPVQTQLASEVAGSGTVRVDVSEGNALVLINGTRAGVTPLSVALPPGSHRVSVSRVGTTFTPAEATVEVREGETAQVRFTSRTRQ